VERHAVILGVVAKVEPAFRSRIDRWHLVTPTELGDQQPLTHVAVLISIGRRGYASAKNRQGYSTERDREESLLVHIPSFLCPSKNGLIE